MLEVVPCQGQVGERYGHPDLDPNHFALVLETADTAALRYFSYRGSTPMAEYLAVDPRPLERSHPWPDRTGAGLGSGPIVEMRRQALGALGVREATDRDLECASYTLESIVDTATSRAQWACVQMGTMWTYVSTARLEGSDPDASPRWLTRVSGTIGGWQYVVVEVVTHQDEDDWEVAEVRMVRNLTSMPPPPSDGVHRIKS